MQQIHIGFYVSGASIDPADGSHRERRVSEIDVCPREYRGRPPANRRGQLGTMEVRDCAARTSELLKTAGEYYYDSMNLF